MTDVRIEETANPDVFQITVEATERINAHTVSVEGIQTTLALEELEKLHDLTTQLLFDHDHPHNEPFPPLTEDCINNTTRLIHEMEERF